MEAGDEVIGLINTEFARLTEVGYTSLHAVKVDACQAAIEIRLRKIRVSLDSGGIVGYSGIEIFLRSEKVGLIIIGEGEIRTELGNVVQVSEHNLEIECRLFG